jgi:hypothetical protein
MKLIGIGSNTGLDLTGAAIDVPLDGTATFLANTAASAVKVTLVVKFSGMVNTSTVTWSLKLGASAITKPLGGVPEYNDSFTTTTALFRLQIPDFILSAFDGEYDTFELAVSSDGADSSVAIATETYRGDAIDSDGRVNVGEILDTAVTLTNDNLDVNVAEVGGNTPAVPPDNWSDMEISTGGEVDSNVKNNEAYGPNNEATG